LSRRKTPFSSETVVADEPGARGLDGHARQDVALGVRDRADDAGIRHLAEHRGGDEGQAHQQDQKSFAHVPSSCMNLKGSPSLNAINMPAAGVGEVAIFP
jgi:hypothetical protein